MIKIYVMNTCPDCHFVEEQVRDDVRYEVIDIGKHVKYLKEFLRLRDGNTAFDEVKKIGAVGIPCFLKADGTVTFSPEDVGLQSCKPEIGDACNIDGTGC